VVAVGFTLQPEVEFLDLCDRLIRDEVDYYEVAPETTWRLRPDGTFDENGYHRRFREIARATGRFFVAHGVGFSVGSSASARDRRRRRRWLARLAADQAEFRYRWYTDHLGASAPDGLAATLPLPLPLSATLARVVGRRLTEMARVVADVGVENNVAYFLLGAPLDEASLYAACACGPRRHLLLDLHNLHTMAENHGLDPEAWLARVPLDRVIEIHVSGGADADPAWVPSGRTMRLDSHDAGVPEEVWRLLERVLPRCPSLRGVTLERMEGTVTAADVPQLVDEVRRARALVRAAARRPAVAPRTNEVALAREELGAWEAVVTRLVLARDPAAELLRLRRSRSVPAALRRRLAQADVDGVVLSSLLVARLRFERLLRGSPAAEAWFDEDAPGFAAAFKRYHTEVPPTAFFPPDEADLFESWRRADIRKSA
jgi:uncharacterized protein (UPF0276 family)